MENALFSTSIVISPSTIITSVNKNLLGSNIQWRGYGDGLLLPNTLKFSESMLDRAKNLAPTVIRYPGGTAADEYHWANGVGTLAQRQFNTPTYDGTPQKVEMGTLEFLELCDETGATPLISVNIANGTAQEAADWVKYVNTNTLLSRRTGRVLPKVTYWEIGNEPYLQEGNPADWITPEAYSKKASAFIQIMKAVDPTIQVGIPLRSDTLGDIPATPYQGFNSKVLNNLTQSFDFVALHSAYMPFYYETTNYSETDLYWSTMASSKTVVDDIISTRNQLQIVNPSWQGKKIAFTEYNASYSLTTDKKPSDAYIRTLAGALYVADVLRIMVEQNISFANFWSLSDNWHFGSFLSPSVSRPAYFVLEKYKQLFQGNVVSLAISTETFNTNRVGLVPASSDNPLVTGLATVNNNTLRVILINKDIARSTNVSIVVAGQTGVLPGTFSTLSATNYFDTRDIAGTINSVNGTVTNNMGNIIITLPKHSFTLIEVPLSTVPPAKT